MKRKTGLVGVLHIAVLSSFAAYALRASLRSAGSAIPLVAFCILMVLIFLLAAVSLERQSAYAAVYRRAMPDLLFSLIGAVGLAAGCALDFHGSMLRMLLSLLGMLAGLGLGVAAVLRWQGKKPSAAWYVLAVVFYVIRLFRDFRHWEINPTILDYCFCLFAMISFMLASFFAGAFSFDRGARRKLAFFSLTGVLFGTVSLAGAALPELLLYGGSIFWMLACAQQMLKK